MGRFAEATVKFKRNLQLSFDDLARVAAVELAARAMDRTPIDTGHLHANWQLSNSTTAPELPFYDRSGRSTLARIEAQAQTLRWDRDFYLVNPTPYALHIEYGTSTMPPRPMIRPTMREWQSIVDLAVSASRRRRRR